MELFKDLVKEWQINEVDDDKRLITIESIDIKTCTQFEFVFQKCSNKNSYWKVHFRHPQKRHIKETFNTDFTRIIIEVLGFLADIRVGRYKGTVTMSRSIVNMPYEILRGRKGE